MSVYVSAAKDQDVDTQTYLPDTLSSSNGIRRSYDDKKVTDTIRNQNIAQVQIPGLRGGFAGRDGRQYQNLEQLWKEELFQDGATDIYDKDKGWYGRAQHFWANEQPTIEGVSGTTDENSEADLRESKIFLKKVQSQNGIRPGIDRALDCGCGIGRVSENLLVKRFKTIDIIEPAPQMLKVACEKISKYNTPTHQKLGRIYNTSLELADLPTEPTYDFIVVQWVSMYLTDNDLVAFLKKCKKALKNGTVAEPKGETNKNATQNDRTGVIFVKENIMHHESFLVGGGSLSLNRCDKHYKAIFNLAGLTLVAEQRQKQWPTHLLPLGMYILY